VALTSPRLLDTIWNDRFSAGCLGTRRTPLGPEAGQYRWSRRRAHASWIYCYDDGRRSTWRRWHFTPPPSTPCPSSERDV